MIRKSLWQSLIREQLNYVRETSVDMAQIKALSVYIKVIKKVRRAALSLLGVGACIVLFIVSLLLIHTTLLHYLPWDPEDRVAFTLIFAAIYMIMAVVGFSFLFSQKKWMEIFSADDLIEKILHDTRKG